MLFNLHLGQEVHADVPDANRSRLLDGTGQDGKLERGTRPDLIIYIKMSDTKKYGKEFWNQIFSEGKKFRSLNSDELNNILGKTKQVLDREIKNAADIGAGTGELTISLAEKGIEVTAFDISNIALEKTRELISEKYRDLITLEELDLNKEEFPDIYKNNFDIIFAKFILGLKSIESEKVLDKIKELLTEKGALVIITPVLVEGQEYNEHQNKISVKKLDFEKVLHSKFNLVEILFEKGETSWPLMAYLCF